MNKEEILSSLGVSLEIIAAIMKDLVLPSAAKSHNSSLERIADGLVMAVMRNDGGDLISVKVYFNELYVPNKGASASTIRRGLIGMPVAIEDMRRIKNSGWMQLFACRNRNITNSWGSNETIALSDIYGAFPQFAPKQVEEAMA